MPSYLNNNNKILVTLAVMKSQEKSSREKTGDNTEEVYQRNVKEVPKTVKGHSSFT